MLSDTEFLVLIRSALLLMIDAIERKLGMPRTAELRKFSRPERACIASGADV